MPRPIRYQNRYPIPADKLYATLVDRAYLEAKLVAIGGTEAALLELTADDSAARYTLRQGVSRKYLPGPAQAVLRGDLLIERTETLRLTAPGRYEGTVAARVKDAPGGISGTVRITDRPDGAEFLIDAAAKVDLPLVGGKIEAAIAEQVVKLMEREGRFTSEWLAR